MVKDISDERRAKQRIYARQYRIRHPDKARASSLKYRTKPEAKAKAAEQERKRTRLRRYNGFYRNRLLKEWEKRYLEAGRPRPDACDICGPSKRRIEFDHCHKRGHFRGWLCHRCNVVLGRVEDDPSLLMKMAAYLQRTQTDTSPQFTLPGI